MRLDLCTYSHTRVSTTQSTQQGVISHVAEDPRIGQKPRKDVPEVSQASRAAIRQLYAIKCGLVKPTIGKTAGNQGNLTKLMMSQVHALSPLTRPADHSSITHHRQPSHYYTHRVLQDWVDLQQHRPDVPDLNRIEEVKGYIRADNRFAK